MLKTSMHTYHLDHAGYVGQIRAKDWPAKEEFRVYSVFGDVTRLDALKEAIFQLLRDNGVTHRHVIINL